LDYKFIEKYGKKTGGKLENLAGFGFSEFFLRISYPAET